MLQYQASNISMIMVINSIRNVHAFQTDLNVVLIWAKSFFAPKMKPKKQLQLQKSSAYILCFRLLCPHFLDY